MKNNSSPFNRRHFLGMAAGAAVISHRAATGNPPAGTHQESFSFAVIADPHCAEGPRAGLEGYGDGADKLLRCFENMETLPAGERPDFALLAGDIHPAALAPHLDKIKTPLHAVAGNHEGAPESRGLLRSLFPEDFGSGADQRDYFRFIHKGVHFIGLCDAGMGGEHVGQFSSELITPPGQCDWLEAEMAIPGTRKVIFAHIPPALDGGDRNMYMARNDSRWFTDLVRKTAPEMLFFGHLHRATEEYKIGASRSVNLRSCCWNFQEAPIGFMLVRVTAHGMEVQEMITGEYRPKQ